MKKLMLHRFLIVGSTAIALLAGTTIARAQVIIDNLKATTTGTWTKSTFKGGFYASNYYFSPQSAAGSTVKWCATLPEAGKYSVEIHLPDGDATRSKSIPVSVEHADGQTARGKTTVYVDATKPSGWQPLATQIFSEKIPSCVTATNPGRGWAIADAIRFTLIQAQPSFTVTNTEKQKILGLGVELQLDSINSGNLGTSSELSAIPLDLNPSERTRLYKDLLSGFRYARIAMGLYYRGLDAEEKTIGPRYPSQLTDLVELMKESGMEGLAPEYWSPAPYWKKNRDYLVGPLRQFDDKFLGEFGDNVVKELKQFTDAGLKISMWGLQNEYPADQPRYAQALYNGTQYLAAFKAVAPKVAAAFPNVMIHATSQNGQSGAAGIKLRSDPEALKYVNAWTWHHVGTDSEKQRGESANSIAKNAVGRPVFNNEFEYLSGGTSEPRMINTAQSIMNWMNNIDAPSFFWLHAGKPNGNSEAEGYALSIWRKPTDLNFSSRPNLKNGHFEYVDYNYNALAGFLAYLPWDSTRHEILESSPTGDQRVLSWKTPAGKMAFAVTNRSGKPYEYVLNMPKPVRLTGHQYDKTPRGQIQADGTGQYLGKTLETRTSQVFAMKIPSMAIQFWTEN